MKLINLENKPTYIVADVHGAFDVFERNISIYDLKDCNIIVAGDCGFGFYKRTYYQNVIASINNHLKERNIHCYMIRGNHDDPSYFDDNEINFSNVKAISDYTVLSINNHNILCVGGALSIDRIYRINNYWQRVDDYAIVMNIPLEEAKSKILPSYWVDEKPIYDENKLNELKENNIDIDIVVTHTSPSFAFKSDKNGIEYWINKDNKLSEELDEERTVLNKLYEKLINDNHPISKWVYGHFHGHNVEVINDIEFTALINCDYNFDTKEINVCE